MTDTTTTPVTAPAAQPRLAGLRERGDQQARQLQ